MPKALGLVPITTPAYSLESHGFAEAFVCTFKRDHDRQASPFSAGNAGRSGARLELMPPSRERNGEQAKRPVQESGNGRAEE